MKLRNLSGRRERKGRGNKDEPEKRRGSVRMRAEERKRNESCRASVLEEDRRKKTGKNINYNK